jgi:hypothetical protein
MRNIHALNDYNQTENLEYTITETSTTVQWKDGDVSLESIWVYDVPVAAV